MLIESRCSLSCSLDIYCIRINLKCDGLEDKSFAKTLSVLDIDEILHIYRLQSYNLAIVIAFVTILS